MTEQVVAKYAKQVMEREPAKLLAFASKEGFKLAVWVRKPEAKKITLTFTTLVLRDAVEKEIRKWLRNADAAVSSH